MTDPTFDMIAPSLLLRFERGFRSPCSIYNMEKKKKSPFSTFVFFGCSVHLCFVDSAFEAMVGGKRGGPSFPPLLRYLLLFR